jgi:hypothetical protein
VVGLRARCATRRVCCARDLEPVVVGADEQVNGVATKPAISGDRVGADLLERVSEVGFAVGVFNGRGDVVRGHGRAPVMARADAGDGAARGVRMRDTVRPLGPTDE